MTEIEANRQHWHQQAYVWMLIAIPLSAVIMGVVMVSLALQSDTGLVVDDYYRKGKQINRVLARDRAAFELGLSASLSIESAQQRVLVRIDPVIDALLDEEISLNFINATRPGLDQRLQLRRIDRQTLRAEIRPLPPGRWNIALQTGSWRLTGSLQYPRQDSLQLLPNYFAE